MLVSKSLTYLLLGLYFFCYTIPQSIFNSINVFDRVSTQILFLAVLNLSSFLLIVRTNTVGQILSVFKKNYHALSYLVFIVFSFISIVVADNLIEGLVTITKYLVFFSTFIIIVFLSKVGHTNFFKVFSILTIFAVFIESTFINYLFYDSVILKENLLQRSNDFKGFTANINISSFSLCLKTPILFYLLFNTRSTKIKGVVLFMIFSSILTILLLGGRASLIALSFILVSVIIISILKSNKSKIINLSLSFLIIALSLSTYKFFNQNNTSSNVIDRFSIVFNPSEDDSVKERLNFYSTAIQSIQKYPLLGIGVGNWKIVSINYSKDIIEDYKVPYFVHNDFLQMLAEIGLFGGLAYMYFIFSPFIVSFKKMIKSCKKQFSRYFLVFLIFGVYIIDSLLNFPMARPVNAIYLLFTIAFYYSINQKNIKNEE